MHDHRCRGNTDHSELPDGAFATLTAAALFRGDVVRLVGMATTASDDDSPDGRPYLPGSFDAVSPVVGFGRWFNPVVLPVLLPLQIAPLGCHLVPPLVRWWRDTPS